MMEKSQHLSFAFHYIPAPNKQMKLSMCLLFFFVINKHIQTTHSLSLLCLMSVNFQYRILPELSQNSLLTSTWIIS